MLEKVDELNPALSGDLHQIAAVSYNRAPALGFIPRTNAVRRYSSVLAQGAYDRELPDLDQSLSSRLRVVFICSFHRPRLHTHHRPAHASSSVT